VGQSTTPSSCSRSRRLRQTPTCRPASAGANECDFEGFRGRGNQRSRRSDVRFDALRSLRSGFCGGVRDLKDACVAGVRHGDSLTSFTFPLLIYSHLRAEYDTVIAGGSSRRRTIWLGVTERLIQLARHPKHTSAEVGERWLPLRIPWP
jgi:hypothetical protein